MNTSKPRKLITQILRWTARILGTLLVLLFVVFLIGEGPPKPSMLTAPEKLGFLTNGAMLLGLILAWRWEGLGGALALSGYLLFGLLAGPRLMVSPFLAGGAAGCLYLLAWWTSDRSEWRQHGGPKRLGISLAGFGALLLLIWVWLGAGARSMQARAENVPNLAGRWVGTGSVSDSLVHSRIVDLDITVLPDGAMQGRVGDATIVSGQVAPSLKRNRRDYLLSRMGVPSFKMSLQLSGPPLATPRRSLPRADLFFDFQAGQMVGGLHLTDLPEDLRDLHVVLRRRE